MIKLENTTLALIQQQPPFYLLTDTAQNYIGYMPPPRRDVLLVFPQTPGSHYYEILLGDSPSTDIAVRHHISHLKQPLPPFPEDFLCTKS